MIPANQAQEQDLKELKLDLKSSWTRAGLQLLKYKSRNSAAQYTVRAGHWILRDKGSISVAQGQE